MSWSGGDYRTPVLRRIPAMGGLAAIVLPRGLSGTVVTGLGGSTSRVVVATQVLDRDEQPVEGTVYVGAAAGPTPPSSDGPLLPHFRLR
jgi:hypothetical protein